MNILVTGGLGYIGSHTCVELLDAGYDIVVVDNLYNSDISVKDRIEKITGKTFKFYEDDVCDEDALEKIFSENKIDAVIHFAAYKAVGESVKLPLNYYENNLTSTIKLCKVMKRHKVNAFVFSSSATVYGSPKTLPIKEDFPLSTTNPYGSTKLYNEGILKDVSISDDKFSVIILRYFNPIGAHSSGILGEDPKGIPNNLMPYIVKVAAGELECLNVFGNDYNTHDGTGVRDYIHVVDLAKGHLKAIEKAMEEPGVKYYNLGTGTGYSVLDLVTTYEKVNNVKVPYKIVGRRPGDIDACYADPTKAYEELGWKAELGIEEMCRDSYLYQEKFKKGLND
jgi:UDP-glucose 4-epimerase